MILAMGDSATFGYLQAIETAKVGHKVWMIGDIGDLTPIDKNHVFLSSVLWTFTNAYKAAIEDIQAAPTARTGTSSPSRTAASRCFEAKYLPADRWKEIGKAKLGIISGKIKVPNCHQGRPSSKLIG